VRYASLFGGVCLLLGCGDTVLFETEDPWQASTGWPGLGDGLILVTNSGDDSLSFLDPITLEPVYQAPTGRVPAEREGPHHGAATPDGRHYFVGLSNAVPGSGSGPHGSHGSGTADGYLLRYDTGDNRRSGEIRVGRNPGDVRLTPGGDQVVQSHFDLEAIRQAQQKGEDPRLIQSPLAVVNASSMERVAMIPVCPAAHGIGVAPDGSAVYLACWGSDELAIVSLAEPISSDAEVTRVQVGPGGGNPVDPLFGPYAVMVSPDGEEVWLSNLEGKSLAVYRVSEGAFDEGRRVTTLGGPLFGTFSADGDRLYVPTQAPDALLTVDPASGEVLDTLSFDPADCRAPHGTLLVTGGELLAVVCEGDHAGSGTVVRVDIAGGQAEVEDAFEVGVYPDDLVLLPGAGGGR
jgi:DNA-binding beta-propeller fold protein YncE